MGQSPLTYVRQLIATCCDPSLINKGIYPSDVIERAKRILQDVGGSMGRCSVFIHVFSVFTISILTAL